MQTRRLGRTDLSIAPLVLGGNVFGWTADKKTSFDVLDRFLAAGLNAIDTADVYSAWAPGNSGGESETIIGEWMKARGNRGKVIVITKVGSPMGRGKEGLKARYIAEAAEASLKRLQTDAIDLYLSHWPDMATPIEETLGAYQRLIEQGKIRWCGASNLSVKLLEPALAAAKAKGLPRYEVLQPEYNLADRHEFEGGLADFVSASRSASSPISASPRASCRASTAARPTSPRVRAARESRPISTRADFASSMRSRRWRRATKPSRPKWRSPGSWRGPGSPRRSPAPPRSNRSRALCAQPSLPDGSRHGRAHRGQRALKPSAF